MIAEVPMHNTKGASAYGVVDGTHVATSMAKAVERLSDAVRGPSVPSVLCALGSVKIAMCYPSMQGGLKLTCEEVRLKPCAVAGAVAGALPVTTPEGWLEEVVTCVRATMLRLAAARMSKGSTSTGKLRFACDRPVQLVVGEEEAAATAAAGHFP